MTIPTTLAASAGLRFAEAVLPGHPDKLADQIADALVDIALQVDDRAIVQVEVAVHDHRCHVNGRISTAGVALNRAFVDATVRGVYERAGFGVVFPGVGDGTDYQCPHPSRVAVDLACVIDVSDPDERAMREYCDDQAIHVGYAIGTPETHWLPMEQYLALRLRDALLELTVSDRTLGAGPDGKLLIALAPLPSERRGFSRWAPVWVVSSVQHLEAASVVELERAVRALFTRVLAEESARMPDLLAAPGAEFVVRVNEAGPFVEGGPINDNGQTGRKLVMDFYGPNVGIGGGALSGKDPWRLDRAGAMRTRQIAVAIVETGFVSAARVTFAWGPRDARPSGWWWRRTGLSWRRRWLHGGWSGSIRRSRRRIGSWGWGVSIGRIRRGRGCFGGLRLLRLAEPVVVHSCVAFGEDRELISRGGAKQRRRGGVCWTGSGQFDARESWCVSDAWVRLREPLAASSATSCLVSVSDAGLPRRWQRPWRAITRCSGLNFEGSR